MTTETQVAMQYLTLTDAMGYQAGPQALSPEEFAEALRKEAERYRWLIKQATQQADPLGPIFRIDVRRVVGFRVTDSIDAAMAADAPGAAYRLR